MVKHLLAFAAALTLPLTPAYAVQESTSDAYGEVDAEKLALAEAILETSYPNDSHIALFQETTDQMEAQMTQSLAGVITDEGALALVKEWQEKTSVETDAIMMRRIPSLMDAWAISFADIYSTQELEDILAFVSTPSGQSFMANQTKVLSHPAFAQANQSFMNETMSVVTGKIPSLVEALREYEESKQASAK